MENITFKNSGELLRLADSLETVEVMVWLSVSGTIDKSRITAEDALKNIKNNYKAMLTDFPVFRLKLITKDDLQYWQYASDKEIQFDHLIKIVDEPLEDNLPETCQPDFAPLWRVYISQIDDKTKIRVSGSHCILDGRGIFDLFDLITTYALNKELNEKLKSYQNQPVLYSYGKKEWYTPEITEKKIDDPYKHFHLPERMINPTVTLPSYMTNTQWDVAYPPISKFCRKHGITPQGILMAIQNEAIRMYNQGEIDDLSIPTYIPIDIRPHSYATDVVRKSFFFSHVGFILPFMENEKDMMKNMKNCTRLLKESLNTTQFFDDSYYSANCRNRETGEFHFSENYPNPYHLVFASHLGLVGGEFKDIQFRNHSYLEENMYWATFYGFHNKDIFSFMFSVPNNTPKEYFNSVKETSLKYFNFIVKDISN